MILKIWIHKLLNIILISRSVATFLLVVPHDNCLWIEAAQFNKAGSVRIHA